ncbi:Oidioi.mRNA.OKI2018_I69.PAR.g10193.t1.cds [Oikopleura dioica]|uniref:Oidioi.mRNA.OKI2018_I69.PAR.g10193.t1.cds n=1 Tax=Oikopleura dioica TaxID=34765 RepID=A0ABN7RPD2_OIKDI|nr:Oidioi.mRNA.OKI2018_I69.PAR.g10193.t1.cds [Oikopleura dioica]
MNMKILTMLVFTSAVSNASYDFTGGSSGNSIPSQRSGMKHDEHSDRRIHQYVNKAQTRMLRRSTDVRFLNATIEIDYKSDKRTLEMFFEFVNGEIRSHKEDLESDEDIKNMKKYIQRHVDSYKWNYMSNNDSIARGVLKVSLDFADAPYLCHNATIIIFKNRLSEVSDEIDRIQQRYNETYHKNVEEYNKMRLYMRSHSFNYNSNIAQIPRSESPINLGSSNVPSASVSDYENLADPADPASVQDEICNGELNKAENQEKCFDARRKFGRVKCSLACKFAVIPRTREIKLTSVEFSWTRA